MKTDKKSANAQLLATVTPRYFLARLKLGMWLRGRSPGLQDLVHRLPKLIFNIKDRTQWHVDEPTLAYRCGGSIGIVLNVSIYYAIRLGAPTMTVHKSTARRRNKVMIV